MDISRPIAILSYHADRAPDREFALSSLEALNLGHAEIEGSYLGQTEPAILVFLNTWDDTAKVKGLADKLDQESVLIVDANRVACLQYTDGRPEESLGEFYKTTADDALSKPSWTRDGGGNYYVTDVQPVAA